MTNQLATQNCDLKSSINYTNDIDSKWKGQWT